jgi:hypothetical protein
MSIILKKKYGGVHYDKTENNEENFCACAHGAYAYECSTDTELCGAESR